MIANSWLNVADPVSHLVTWTLVSGILMLGARRMETLIRLFAGQSLFLILITLAQATGHQGSPTVWLLAGVAFAIKCLVIPLGLFHVFRRLEIRSQLQAYIQPSSLMLLGGLALLLVHWLSYRISLTGLVLPLQLFSCGLSLVLFGFLLMLARKKAMTQLIGLYMLDNGIFALAVALVFEMPLMLEMGIFLELLLGAMVMGLMIFRIRQAFDSIDVSHLQQLKG